MFVLAVKQIKKNKRDDFVIINARRKNVHRTAIDPFNLS